MLIQAWNNAVINKGSWGGSNLYNYGYKTIDSKLVINETEAETVIMIYAKLIEGWGCLKIANYLNHEGIPDMFTNNKNPRTWSRTSVYQILVNKIYIGQRTWQKSILNVPDLRIISDHDFNTVQKMLTERKTTSAQFSAQQKYTYLFDKGLMKCGKCGRVYFGIHRYNVYKCASGKFRKGCGNTSVKIDFIESEIQKLLINEYINLVLLGIETGTNTKNLKISADLQKQELKKLIQKADRIKELYIEGNYSKVEYQLKKDLNAELISKTELNIEALENQIQSAGVDRELSKISRDS